MDESSQKLARKQGGKFLVDSPEFSLCKTEGLFIRLHPGGRLGSSAGMASVALMRRKPIPSSSAPHVPNTLGSLGTNGRKTMNPFALEEPTVPATSTSKGNLDDADSENNIASALLGKSVTFRLSSSSLTGVASEVTAVFKDFDHTFDAAVVENFASSSAFMSAWGQSGERSAGDVLGGLDGAFEPQYDIVVSVTGSEG